MSLSPDDPSLAVAPSTDVGSARLAAALAAVDVAAIGRALRQDYVIVPLLRGSDGRTQTRVVSADDAEGERRWVLCVFSSTRAFADFVQDDPQREFAIRTGASLAGTIESYRHLLLRIDFDPAGPHPVTAEIDDVLAALAPDPSDDPVRWITEGDDDSAHGLRPGERVAGLDLALPDDWARIDLTDSARTADDVSSVVARQLQGLAAAPVLRGQLTAWLASSARAAAAGGGREMAFLVRRTESAAAALSVTTYAQQLGEAPAGTHLDAVVDRLRPALAEADELSRARTASGPFVRHVHTSSGAAELEAEGTALLVADYWLENPDARGISLVSFSTPHVDAREAMLLLTDNVVLGAAWQIQPSDEDDPGGNRSDR
jgi:hypothetical protein